MKHAARGTVRIIGGRWRGSKLAVADSPGLRPTSDRVRETLFNWLQPRIAEANVLDLFAGTGALGLEAASRGAGRVVLVERDPAVAAALRTSVARLAKGDDARVEVACADALQWLGREPQARFDLVFLDPPFADGLWDKILPALSPWLADDAWLYVEAPREAVPTPGRGWLPHREGSTREVRYALYRRAADTLRPVSAEQDPARA